MLMVRDIYWRKVSIGSGYGWVPSGTEPLPEPVLNKIDDVIIYDKKNFLPVWSMILPVCDRWTGG